MANNPIPILVIFVLLKNRNALQGKPLHLESLQLESLVDNLHTAIHAYEKVSNFSHGELASNLPDMKKIMEIVEKIPL